MLRPHLPPPLARPTPWPFRRRCSGREPCASAASSRWRRPSWAGGPTAGRSGAVAAICALEGAVCLHAVFYELGLSVSCSTGPAAGRRDLALLSGRSSSGPRALPPDGPGPHSPGRGHLPPKLPLQTGRPPPLGALRHAARILRIAFSQANQVLRIVFSHAI